MSYRIALKGWAQANLTKLKERSDGEWADFCCAHGERDASAAVNLISGWVHCNSCGFSGWSDQYAIEYSLAPPPEKPRDGDSSKKPKGRMVVQAEYVYRDPAGNEVFKVVRKGDEFGNKTFSQWRWDGSSWVPGMKGVRRVLYHLPELAAANPSEPVFFVEGEKDVHQAERLRLVATTTPQGAESPGEVKDWSPLSGRSVIIVPDNDQKGREYTLKVAELMEGVAASVKVLHLPGLGDKEDLSDWVAAGGDRKQLEELLKSAQPVNAGEPWPKPIPLDSSGTPSWPDGLLPESLERFTDAVSEMNQTPRAQAKMMSIPVLSAATQGLYQVEVNGRTENLATFVCVAASTGERKSSDIRLVKGPLVSFEMESHRLTREKQRKDTYEVEILAERVEKLKRTAAKTGEDSDKEAYFAVRAKLDSLGSVTSKTLLAQDITPEKLAGLMSEQGESIAIMSAEGGPLENIKSRYQKASSVSPIYMEGFSGEEVIVHRKRSEYGDIKLFNPSLTMGIMTQPGHLASILADRDFTGRGLLERFLWCIAEERIGYRGRGKAISPDVVTGYHEAMKRILPAPGHRKVGGSDKRRTLQIGGEGLAHLFRFAENLEPRFRPGGDLREVRGWASRLPTAVVKIATLWHIYSAAESGEEVPGIVSTRWVEAALRWVESFAIPMGLKTFGIMGSDAGVDMARRVLEEITENGYAEFRKSEFKDKHFKTIPAREVKLGYDVLVERGFIRRKKVETGGRAATIFEVNPAALCSPEKSGEEVGKREKKGPEREDNLQNRLSPYKGDLDPFSLTKETDKDTICSIPDSSSGKKGKKSEKGPDQTEEVLVSDLLEGII